VEESQILLDLSHPDVTTNPGNIKSKISIYKDAYSATKNTHAIIICTEWDEFMVNLTN
jgi:UDPglucose 6-dehydrogenase